jgi:hypothetical protein
LYEGPDAILTTVKANGKDKQLDRVIFMLGVSIADFGLQNAVLSKDEENNDD